MKIIFKNISKQLFCFFNFWSLKDLAIKRENVNVNIFYPQNKFIFSVSKFLCNFCSDLRESLISSN